MKVLAVLTILTIIIILEFSTPQEYVFGYLYTGAILLVSYWFGRIFTLQITIISVFLTLLNIVFPGSELINFSSIANRVIAVISLIISGFLSDRLHRYHDAIVQQQLMLDSQAQLARIREDFVSTLTHDLKTPLLGAIETIKAFQQEKFGAVSPRQQDVLATMVRSHSNSLQLLETLLDVYRNDTEGIQLNLAPVDLTILAEDVTSTLTELAANRRIHLSCSYADSDWKQSLWVNGDALQLQRVISNLLINAINHSRRGERVEIILESTTSYQIVKILDTGAGIQPEEFFHLFSRFYQGNTQRQGKGFGLGLYLSRQIIEAHGGIIWAENRLPKGAIFAFKLPILLYQVTGDR
ncbi:HAMP domain-containing histidine kinase [Sphaerospermopsis aphanizomenoides BCCUSP55]|uniref:sensor histidine kinase n=1 Tax=Sphaerospermopsis aphanizomenoides TaxID=459663 RepID=UPI001906B73C|nr:HAMP domain-containing sensor histidine kinase [Sphaerospermopsis aphanizomenoides]MBK1988592.1 HAMP domain-containing histidine kinase [Sphaerospermopsis aphanizomenoides BCCUSP55]